jgi:hypothetical protein
MKPYRMKKLLRLMHVALLVVGFLASDVRAAVELGATAPLAGERLAGCKSSCCTANNDDLPIVAIRPSNGTEFAPSPTNKPPQDEAVSGAVASFAASASVHVAAFPRNTESRAPASGSLVTRHARLQI